MAPYHHAVRKLYMEEGKYYYAYQLIEHYDPDLASAKEKALIYEKVGELERSAKEYAKLGDWESLKKAGILLWQAKRPQEALELLNRSLCLAPKALICFPLWVRT